jgi:SAM-dependent methyltransferase
MSQVKPMAVPGMHSLFLKFFETYFPVRNITVLDLAAGHGAFTKDLYEAGFKVEACDLFPENFYFDQVKCRKADVTKPLPYDDNYFDSVVAMEIAEHITDHQTFFREIQGVLKPKGKLLVSTPNILSLKSRWRFFVSGFYYTFCSLELRNYNGLQHVAGLTVDQYNYIGIKSGFKDVETQVDKYQRTSLLIGILVYPFMWCYGRMKRIAQNQNTAKLLLGRKLFLIFEKD